MADKSSASSVRLLSNAGLVSLATLASRVTGFIRDIFIAALLGAGPLAEIFVIAFRLPNLFRRLFAEGAFNAAFVPLFSERLQQEGRAAALAFAGQVLSVLLAALCVFTLLAQIFMPALVLALAQGFSGEAEKFDAAVHYARISFPYLIAMSLVALFAAMLNAVGRFFAAAFAPILLNLVLISAMLAALAQNGAPLDYIIWGVALAGLAQFIFVFIAARRAGLHVPLVRPRLSADVRRVWHLAVPGILAAGIGQINLLVGTSIATGQAGAAAWLYYADRLYQLPMGVIGVALSVALLPALARQLAAGDTQGATSSQAAALWAAGLLTLPAASGLFVLAEPIVSVLFQRGAFGAADTKVTAQVVQAFCFGLPAFVFVKALQPSFFARQDTKTPLIDGAIGVAVNISLSLWFFASYGALAIAAATSTAGWVTLVLMMVRLRARGIFALNAALARRLVAQGLAALAMGGALVLAQKQIGAGIMGQDSPPDLPPDLPVQIIHLAGLIVLGAALFFALARALGALRAGDFDRLRGRA